MAPPAEMNKNLPETLPADFGDWDGEGPAAGAVESAKVDHSPKSDPADQSHRGPVVREAVSRQFVPNEPAPKPTPTRESTARELAPRNIDSERTAPIPRSPLGPPPNARSYATPTGKGPRAVPPPSAAPSEDEVFFRRLRSLNTVVDTLPATAPPREDMASVVSLPAPVPGIEKAPAIKVEEEEHPLSFRTDLSEPVDEEERRARRKWMAIIAVGIGVVALVVFQLFHYGTLSQVRHIVAVPATTTTSNDGLPEAITPEDGPAQPVASKPAASSASVRDEETSDETATPAADSGHAPVPSRMMHDQLLAPSRIPKAAKTAGDAAPAEGFNGANMAALGGSSPTVFNGSSQSKAPAVTLKSVTVSAGVATGMLIHKTQPIYPSIAKAARVTGTVVIEATISKSGAVVGPHVLSGPQMLRQAALDAVKTWRYKPYRLNNEPTEVDTTVDVIFALGN